MQRTRIIDVQNSTLPKAIGLCASDTAGICSAVNEAVSQLILAAGETGWWGTFARMVFNVATTDPYITLPREVARLINIDVCRRPTRIQNEFYEFLEFGNGWQGDVPQSGNCNANNSCKLMEGYDRGIVVTFADLVPGNKVIRVYPTDARDAAARTLIQGLDQNSNVIYSDDGAIQVEGVYLNLNGPFQSTPMVISKLTGIQKDVTAGIVRYYEYDTVTMVSRLLLTMQPTETTASYRRLFLNGLPNNCCTGSTPGTSQVTAMAKLEFIPCRIPEDYTLINNINAIKEECQSQRYSDMDNPTAFQLSTAHHRTAVNLLNKELMHYQGKQNVAIQFHPFGSARLEAQAIGTLY